MTAVEQLADPAPLGVPVGLAGTRVDIAERPAWHRDGWLPLAAALVLIAAAVWLFVSADAAIGATSTALGVTGGVLVLLAALVFSALTVVSPGQTKVVQFFGRYVGTVRRTGLVMVTPLSTQRRVSVRVRNFETSELKVNDAHGNPVNIAAIIVWQVTDTARASFAVEDYADFVTVQAEAALRRVATSHPYDGPDDGTSLRGSTDQVSGELATEVAERVAIAGVEVVEARISRLAYAPEIAQAMLQRQQAGAIIAARSQIVEGAVGMVEQALARLESEGIVALDDERRAAMVSNLLVVLCGESRATPVLNTGSLYA